MNVSESHAHKGPFSYSIHRHGSSFMAIHPALAVAASPRQTILLARRTARTFSCGAARIRCCAVTWLDVFLEQIPPRPRFSCVQLQEGGLHVSFVEPASPKIAHSGRGTGSGERFQTVVLETQQHDLGLGRPDVLHGERTLDEHGLESSGTHCFLRHLIGQPVGDLTVFR